MTNESPTQKTYTSFVLYDEDEYEQRLNNVETTSEQGTDNVETISEQCTDNVPTTSVQKTDKNQTSVARAAKRPQDTHYTVYKNNLDIVKILTNSKFIKVNTNGTYRSIDNLPLTRAPIDLTNAVNRCGYPVSRDELAKIYTAANVCRRVPKFKVWAISVFTCVLSVYLTTVAMKIADTPTNGKTSVLSASIIGTANDHTDIATIISDFEKKNRFKFFPYRKEVINKEIVKSGDYSAANCEIILQQNMAAQIRATKK